MIIKVCQQLGMFKTEKLALIEFGHFTIQTYRASLTLYVDRLFTNYLTGSDTFECCYLNFKLYIT